MANRIVECVEFRSLLVELDKRYPVPAIMSEIDKLLMSNLMSHLNDVRKVENCVDIWSRKGLTASYLGITFVPKVITRGILLQCCKKAVFPSYSK